MILTTSNNNISFTFFYIRFLLICICIHFFTIKELIDYYNNTKIITTLTVKLYHTKFKIAVSYENLRNVTFT